jgi:HPr kinase/phosphorylase
MHDEFLLESRLMGLLREKIDRICFRHGVLLNICGRGVLLAGDSGIGKTTLGIRLARRGHLWVADDVIEIERKGSRLLARGHRRSRRLVHVKASGITETRRIIKQGNRLDETVLDMVIEAVRRDRPRPGGASKDKEAREILSIMVPCLEIAVDTGRYMTVSRVEQAVHSVFKRRQEG